jgi:hypothetical protein
MPLRVRRPAQCRCVHRPSLACAMRGVPCVFLCPYAVPCFLPASAAHPRSRARTRQRATNGAARPGRAHRRDGGGAQGSRGRASSRTPVSLVRVSVLCVCVCPFVRFVPCSSFVPAGRGCAGIGLCPFDCGAGHAAPFSCLRGQQQTNCKHRENRRPPVGGTQGRCMHACAHIGGEGRSRPCGFPRPAPLRGARTPQGRLADTDWTGLDWHTHRQAQTARGGGREKNNEQHGSHKYRRAHTLQISLSCLPPLPPLPPFLLRAQVAWPWR